MLAASRISGSYEYDNIHNCLPPGMPAMMSAAYGMEIMQDEQKITFFSEHQDALRRVYLDGRKPTPEVLADPTYAGYSTGRWEGDTLVVDTVALTTKSYIDGSSPHSDKMTVQERMRFVEPGVIENQITVNDPEALTEPWRVDAPLPQGVVSERRAARVRVRGRATRRTALSRRARASSCAGVCRRRGRRFDDQTRGSSAWPFSANSRFQSRERSSSVIARAQAHAAA